MFISSAYSRSEKCLDNGIYTAADNVILTFPDGTYCNNPGGINLSGITNLTIVCSSSTSTEKYVRTEGGMDFDVSGAQITFIDCNVDVFPTGDWIDDVGTQIEVRGGSVEANIDLLTTLGIYDISELINVDVEDVLSQPITVFDVNVSTLSGNPIVDQLFSNDNTIYVTTNGYIGGVKTSYNNFNVEVSSSLFGTTNSSIQNLSVTHSLSYILQDVIVPSIVDEGSDFTNVSLDFDITFSELVNGTIEILNEGFVPIVTNTFFPFSLVKSISAVGLTPDTLYKLNINVEDRFGNLYSDTIDYRTYIALNVSKSVNDTFVYIGDPQSTSSFNFTGSVYDIKVEFLEPVNLSNQNLSNEIVIRENLVSIDSGSRFNKIARLFFYNLPYQSLPIVLRDGSICSAPQCEIESFASRTLVFNVSGFSNYSTVSNSVLSFNSSNVYVGKDILLMANYSDYVTNNSLVINSSCGIVLDSAPLVNMTYNLTSHLYEHNVSYSIYGNHSYEIRCLNDAGYDNQNLSVNLSLEYQLIDNFTTFLNFKRKVGFPASKITNLKNVNVTITSVGNNNTGSYFDTSYYFMITRDVAYPQTGWETVYNLTSWVNIGKNEFFRIYNNDESFTSYELVNGSIGNFSQFIFIDEDETSLYVNVKACATGGNCKYFANSNNNVIFEDTSPPNLIGIVNISESYNQNSVLNFTFRVRDLESKVASTLFSVMPNGTFVNPSTVTGFNEDANFTFISGGYSFIEGKYYKVILEATNSIGLVDQFPSVPFLIDTMSPVNSTFNISLNGNDYENVSLLDLNFSIGNDYNENYSSLNKTASGLDYASIYVKNATLLNDVCGGFGVFAPINRTFNESEINYTINLSSGYCYMFEYHVLDRAGNVNVVSFSKVVKIDATAPVIGLVKGIQILDYTDAKPNNAEDINRYYEDLDSSLVMFKVQWNMSDAESTIDYFDIELVDNNTGFVVKNWTNYTSQNLVIYYNESYIFDNHNYKVRVTAVNKAGIYSSSVETNGATIFILKIPQLQVQSSMEVMPNYVLDLSNDNDTTLEFRDINDFNISCKIYDLDIGYDNDSGVNCSFVSQGRVSCSFNSLIGLNNFYVSCKSNESIKFDRTYNDENDNYDLQIFVEENDAPYIVSVNGNASYPTSYNLSETDVLSLDIVMGDDDTLNYPIYNFVWDIGSLQVEFNGTNYRNEHTELQFINDTSVNVSYLVLEDLGNLSMRYKFYFNGSINYSTLDSLSSAKVLSYLKFIGPAGDIINGSVSYDYLGVDNVSSIFVGGISNVPYLVDVISSYNISFDNNGSLIWDVSDDVRNGTHSFTVNISDGVDFVLEMFTVNVSPIYHAPVLNLTYYNSNNSFVVNTETFYSINLSSYFYEDNTEVGLSDFLSFFVMNENLVEVVELNSSFGLIYLIPQVSGVGSLVIGARNLVGNRTIALINFSISSFDDNSIPSISVNSPGFNENITSDKKQVYLNASSNESLRKISLTLSGIEYIACEGYCFNYSGFVYVGNLVDGNNSLTVSVLDAGNSLNFTIVNINFSLDTDLNGTLDLIDVDSDGDAVLDVVDSIIGTNNSLFTNIVNYNFSINGSTNLSLQYNGSYPVLLKDDNYTYVEFVFNFAILSLDLRGSSVILDENGLDNSILVSGINLGGGTKSVYVPKSNDNRLSTMCVKDSVISSITQLTSSCSAIDEVRVVCPSVVGVYNCSSSTQGVKEFWKLDGLSHSGAKLMCTENWQYSAWTVCSSSLQTRTAIDLNGCGTVFARDILSQTCDSGDGGGGGGGGGGSSHSSSSSDPYVPPVVENETEIVVNEPVVDKPKLNEPIYLGNFATDNLNIEIDFVKNYTIVYQSKMIEGNFVFTDGGIVFKSKDDSLSLSIASSEEEVDLNNDGETDIKLYVYEENGKYFLRNNVIVRDVKSVDVEPENDEPIVSTPDVAQESSYIMIIVGVVLGVLVLGGAGFFIFKNMHKQTPTVFVDKTVNAVTFVVPPKDFDELTSRFLAYSEKLKGIVFSEKDILEMLQKDARVAVRSGYSWVDVYFVMKQKGVSDFFIRQVVDFGYLVDKFEEFYVKNEVETLPEDLRKKLLLSQDWFQECYFYDGTGSVILNDIMFMLAGVNIYGFKRDKFKAVLEDEFMQGVKNFDKNKVNLSKINLNEKHIERVLMMQKEIANLRVEVANNFKMVNMFKMPTHQEMELEDYVKDLIVDIDKHLK